MILKGIISTINERNNTAEIILPEYDNAITGELPFYRRSAEGANVGEFVVIALFNGGNDLSDGVII
jgi:phage baseplate assembly protein gpV